MPTKEPYSSMEKHQTLQLTDAQIDEIAKRAAEQAVALVMEQLTSNFYREVGKGVVNKGLTLLGLLGTGLAVWLHSKGYISFFK